MPGNRAITPSFQDRESATHMAKNAASGHLPRAGSLRCGSFRAGLRNWHTLATRPRLRPDRRGTSACMLDGLEVRLRLGPTASPALVCGSHFSSAVASPSGLPTPIGSCWQCRPTSWLHLRFTRRGMDRHRLIWPPNGAVKLSAPLALLGQRATSIGAAVYASVRR